MDGSSMLKNQSFESSKVIAVTCISSIYANNFVVMGSLVGEKDGDHKIVSDTPPTHYQVIIRSFSLLFENAEKYESAEFEAGGYKWKLVLHPNGNKSKNVEDHISLYLATADATSLPLGWEVSAVFRLFLLDQNQDNYLIVQDSQRKQRRFRRLTPEWGFDQFIPITYFAILLMDTVDDTCELGAEVFVRKERSTGKGECLKMIKDPDGFNHRWKIENLAKLDSDYYDSREFTVAGYKWEDALYPKGIDSGTGNYSLVLSTEVGTNGVSCKEDETVEICIAVMYVKTRKAHNVPFSCRESRFMPQVGKVVLQTLFP
ncbi:hypothetical protein Pint_24417 [Pistacia integerrima]|uniref:Uncharacterized protein n=1 Tax=Pistacia integerrima TaxID=434235 RepID=A0ACC0YG65_9ROSI|nr:hypothetical protein Pint_24417 [Pistacia integerrima]